MDDTLSVIFENCVLGVTLPLTPVVKCTHVGASGR